MYDSNYIICVNKLIELYHKFKWSIIKVLIMLMDYKRHPDRLKIMHKIFSPLHMELRSYALSAMYWSVVGSISPCWSHNSILPWESKAVRMVPEGLIYFGVGNNYFERSCLSLFWQSTQNRCTALLWLLHWHTWWILERLESLESPPLRSEN